MLDCVTPFKGLVAAMFAPSYEDRSLDLDAMALMVERPADQEIAAMYVLGSTGEGRSSYFDERYAVAESFVSAAGGRLPALVQVGSESLIQARQLAVHTSRVGGVIAYLRTKA
jgi:N-acetylneuraminate lyase